MCESVLPAFLNVYHLCVLPEEATEDIRSLGIGVRATM